MPITATGFLAYRHDELPENLEHVEDAVVVLEGMEQWVKELIIELDAESVRQHWQRLLQKWLLWESDKQGRVRYFNRFRYNERNCACRDR